MEASLQVFRQVRGLLMMVVKDLTEEQFLAVPEGFDNNIAWNLGHILVAQRGLCYRQCGLDMGLPRKMFAMYVPGTSPAGWTSKPDIPALLEMVMGQVQDMEADHQAGKFSTPYQEMKTTTGLHLRNIEEATSFNNYHEGLHMGAILALKNFVVK